MENIKNRIISLAEYYSDEQLNFLVDICNQNSHSYNKNGVDRVAPMIIDGLDGILPQHETRKQEQFGDHHLLKNTTADRAIYLVGHMDTVFPPDHPFQECQINGDLLTGPGTGDMKGGLVVIVYALKILKDLNLPDRLRLAAIFNSDEEIGSISSREIFLEEREKAVICLGAECAGLHNDIVVGRNGKMEIKVKCFGKGSHVGNAAGNTSQKASATVEMSRQIIALESLNGFQPGVAINAGKIVNGGLGSNTVPSEASFLADIRWEPRVDKEVILSKIKTTLIQQSQPGSRSEFEVMNSRPAMPASDGNRELFEIMQKVGKKLGQEIPREHRRGTSDVNFFGAAGIPTLDGLGPIADKDHTPGEFIKISSLKERTALLALFLWEYGHLTGMIEK